MLKIGIKKQIGAVLMQEGAIKAVHNKDLEVFLKSLGEFENVINGKKTCYFCGKVVTLDSIMSIFPMNNEVAFCCKEENCYTILIEKGKNNG